MRQKIGQNLGGMAAVKEAGNQRRHCQVLAGALDKAAAELPSRPSYPTS